jgi:hypothetical protein
VTDLLSATVRLPPSVVCKAFPAETVLLDLNTGHYHGLPPAAGPILDVLARTGGVRAAAARIAEQTHRPRAAVEHEVCELCGGLLERGLLELADAKALPPSAR